MTKIADNSDSTPLLRICHLADVHLGYRRYTKLTKLGMNQREADVSLAFQEAISRIISLHPDAVIIAGDLFHAVRPSNHVVTFCFRQLRRLASETKAPVVIVAGNHETPKRIDTGSVLQLFAEIPGVHVADTGIEVFTFPEKNLAVTCLPHPALVSAQKLALRADDRFKHNVLVAHAQVNERWVSDFGGAEIDLKSLSPHEWDYIALGHVHLHRAVAMNAAYCGAIEHTSASIWAESRELRGFLEVALPSGKRSFHPLTSPREVVVCESIDASSMDPVDVTKAIVDRGEAIAGGIDGKIVRIEVTNLSRETYRHLDHKELRALRGRALNLTLDLSFSAQTTSATNLTRQSRGSLREELGAFAKGWEIPGFASEEIEQCLASYVARVEAKYEAS